VASMASLRRSCAFAKAMNNSTTEFVTLICYLTAKGECSCACSMANYACLLQI
jgi:hypothetical protein